MPNAHVTAVLAEATAAALVGERSETRVVTGVAATATGAALAAAAYSFPIVPPIATLTLTTYAPLVQITHGAPAAYLAIYDGI